MKSPINKTQHEDSCACQKAMDTQVVVTLKTDVTKLYGNPGQIVNGGDWLQITGYYGETSEDPKAPVHAMSNYNPTPLAYQITDTNGKPIIAFRTAWKISGKDGDQTPLQDQGRIFPINDGWVDKDGMARAWVIPGSVDAGPFSIELFDYHDTTTPLATCSLENLKIMDDTPIDGYTTSPIWADFMIPADADGYQITLEVGTETMLEFANHFLYYGGFTDSQGKSQLGTVVYASNGVDQEKVQLHLYGVLGDVTEMEGGKYTQIVVDHSTGDAGPNTYFAIYKKSSNLEQVIVKFIITTEQDGKTYTTAYMKTNSEISVIENNEPTDNYEYNSDFFELAKFPYAFTLSQQGMNIEQFGPDKPTPATNCMENQPCVAFFTSPLYHRASDPDPVSSDTSHWKTPTYMRVMCGGLQATSCRVSALGAIGFTDNGLSSGRRGYVGCIGNNALDPAVPKGLTLLPPSDGRTAWVNGVYKGGIDNIWVEQLHMINQSPFFSYDYTVSDGSGTVFHDSQNLFNRVMTYCLPLSPYIFQYSCTLSVTVPDNYTAVKAHINYKYKNSEPQCKGLEVMGTKTGSETIGGKSYSVFQFTYTPDQFQTDQGKNYAFHPDFNYMFLFPSTDGEVTIDTTLGVDYWYSNYMGNAHIFKIN